MKILRKWRYGVLYSLFLIGLISLLMIVGEDERPMEIWLETRCGLLLLSLGSFYAMAKLCRYWEEKGEIRLIN